MKTIKSITKNKITIKINNVNGMYFILYNDRPIANSMEFNYINSIFDLWIDEL